MNFMKPETIERALSVAMNRAGRPAILFTCSTCRKYMSNKAVRSHNCKLENAMRGEAK